MAAALARAHRAGAGAAAGAAVTGPAGFDDLVTAATVGLARRPLELDSLAGPAGAHAGLLDSGDPAAALLDAAALLGSARRAGVIAVAAGPAAAGPVPAGPVPAGPGAGQPAAAVPGAGQPAAAVPGAAAAADTAPGLGPPASGVVAHVLGAGDAGLVADLLTAAAAAGFRAPAPMLPALLDAAVRESSLRSAVAAVLGQRGRWLAAHRSDWGRVAGTGNPPVADDPGVWETGGRGERRAWLAALRQREPAAARDLLAAGWPRETGADREDLLRVLEAGLSAADEPFLEAALDDRRSAVRQVAAGLLAAIPASALLRRRAGRGMAALRIERRSLHRELVVTLPESCDEAATRDGISPAPPGAAIGARVGLLTQFVAAVPLAEWTAAFGLGPAALASLPVRDGFRADVHVGWRLAAVAQHDAAWAAALLAADEGAPGDGSGPAGLGPPGRSHAGAGRPPGAWPAAAELAMALPAAERMARARAVLVRNGPGPEAAAALAGCPGPWAESLAGAVLEQFTSAVQAGRRPRQVALLLPLAAARLPVTGRRDYAACLRALAGPADLDLITRLRAAADVVDRRRLFLQELQ